jgi:TatD DNase family protein
MNKFVDTHAHLYWDSYEADFDQMLDRVVEAGVGLVINIGTDVETSKKAAELSSEKLPMYATVGLHPHEGAVLLSEDAIADQMAQIQSLYEPNKDKVVGIGETGLDFYFRENPGYKNVTLNASEGSPADAGTSNKLRDSSATPQNDQEIQKENQKRLFRAQIDVAKQLHLPLIIHCRDAWDTIFDFPLSGTTGVFHTFSGSAEDAHSALDLGYYLSFSCILTYPKNQALRDLLTDLPLDRILTETDCPFLPPQAIRGQRNDPSYIPEVVKVIAEMTNKSEEYITGQIWENTHMLFSLKNMTD